MKKFATHLFACFLVSISSWTATAQDYAGSSDHSLITRYPGSVITWYEVQDFEPYRIAIGPVTSYRHIDDWLQVEGSITRINYSLKGDRSFYEVYSNYVNAIKKAEFEVLAEGYDKSSSVQGRVGQRGFLGVHYATNPVPPGKSLLLQGSSTSGGSGYVAAQLQRPEGTAYVVIGTAQYSQNEIVVLLDIIEQQAMEDDLVSVDADAMSKGIDRYGKVALYGIYFEYDKAVIKTESEAALKEIATLLRTRPALELYVVGHTDMKGLGI